MTILAVSALLALSGPWTLSSLTEGGHTARVNVSVAPTVTFLQGRVGGSTSCNMYTGSYQASGSKTSAGRLSFGPLETTRRACDDHLDELEARFLKLMSSARTFVEGNNTLIVAGPAGRLTFVRAR